MNDRRRVPGTEAGEIVRRQLGALGWSQAELARRMSYSPKHLSNVLRGDIALSVTTAVRIESVIGVNAGYLMTLEIRRLLQHEREVLAAEVRWKAQGRRVRRRDAQLPAERIAATERGRAARLRGER